ncbi:MAG: GtrA family protein [bacterium]
MRQAVAYVRNHKWLAERKGVRQFIKFCIVGVGNTIADFVVYFALTRYLGIFYLVANFISFITAATLSFVLNKFWTFRDNRRHAIKGQYAKFLLVSTIGAVLAEATLFLFVHYFSVNDLIAKLLVAGIIVFWNFFANKYWTFRQKINIS